MPLIATMVTCPRRWKEFQQSRRNFEAVRFPFPLRVFQTPEDIETPRVNACLNARAALRYAARHLPDSNDSWVLYLEDDVLLHAALAELAAALIDLGNEHNVACWYLCNRRVPYSEARSFHGFLAYRLTPPIIGAQALLFPKRYIKAILARHWTLLPDDEIFAVLTEEGANIFQVIRPVLVEHLGQYSTFNPFEPQKLEVNNADSPGCY